MILMGIRALNLEKSLSALLETGYYLLVQTHEGFISIAEAGADDIGIYYFIPFAAKIFSLPLPVAIDYFFYGMLGVAFSMFLLSIFLLSNIWVVIYSGVSFFLLYREGFFRLTDTYIAGIFCTFTLVPFFLWLFKSTKKIYWYHYSWMFFSGIIIGYAHYIRLYSSLPVLFFISAFVVFIEKTVRKNKIILFIFLLSGLTIPILHMQILVTKADSFLNKNSLTMSTVPYTHSFWHNIYAGLGYTENYLGITYSDFAAAKAAQKLHPGVEYHSNKYEKVLQNEVLRIICKERFLFGVNLFAKLGVLFFFIFACANIGLFTAYFYPKGSLDYIFWLSMGLAGLPGLMVVPRVSYLSGLAALAFVYGIYSIIWGLKKELLIKGESNVLE